MREAGVEPAILSPPLLTT